MNFLDNFTKHKIFLFACRMILASVFIYASIHKIVHPDKFAQIVYGYGLFHKDIINLVAITVPFLELTAGIFLFFNIKPKASVLIINCMLFAFIAAITINLLRGYKFDCGCFSFGETNSQSSSIELLIRDIIYFSMGVYILFKTKKA